MSEDTRALVARLGARAAIYEQHVSDLFVQAHRFDQYAGAAKNSAQSDYYANRADSYRRQAETPAQEAKLLRDALAALSAPPTPEGKLAAADKLAEAVERMALRLDKEPGNQTAVAMWLHLLDAYRTPAPPPEPR